MHTKRAVVSRLYVAKGTLKHRNYVAKGGKCFYGGLLLYTLSDASCSKDESPDGHG